MYGDSQYTLSVLHAYQQKTRTSAHLVNHLKYKESKISSKQIVTQYSLPASDEDFKSFSKTFDDVTRAAILDIYGKFSEFTTPILSLDIQKSREKSGLSSVAIGANAREEGHGQQ